MSATLSLPRSRAAAILPRTSSLSRAVPTRSTPFFNCEDSAVKRRSSSSTLLHMPAQALSPAFW